MLLSITSGFPIGLMEATSHRTLPQGLRCLSRPSHVQYSSTSYVVLRGVTTTSAIQVVNNHYPIEGYKEKIFCQMLHFFFLKYSFCSFSVFSFLVTSLSHPSQRKSLILSTQKSISWQQLGRAPTFTALLLTGTLLRRCKPFAP